jgi:hypothetical protein
MEPFAELMQRLLEIQSGGRQRSPELIAEGRQWSTILARAGIACVLLLVLLAILGYSPVRFS